MNKQKTDKRSKATGATGTTGTTGTTGGNVGAHAPLAIGERERARIARWRGHVARQLKEIEGAGAFIPAAWLEEIERRPMVDVIADWLTGERLTGFRGEPTGHMSARVEYLRGGDEYDEARGTRARNNHEREIAHMAVLEFMLKSNLAPAGRQRELVRRFYRAGDKGLRPAVARAVLCALDWEREADEADGAPTVPVATRGEV